MDAGLLSQLDCRENEELWSFETPVQRGREKKMSFQAEEMYTK